MSNQAIPAISGLLNPSGDYSADEQQLIGKLLSKYPYFLPLRYAKAKNEHNNGQDLVQVLANSYSYTGNRLQFCSFLYQQPYSASVSGTDDIQPVAIEELAEQTLSIIEIASETDDDLADSLELSSDDPDDDLSFATEDVFDENTTDVLVNEADQEVVAEEDEEVEEEEINVAETAATTMEPSGIVEIADSATELLEEMAIDEDPEIEDSKYNTEDEQQSITDIKPSDSLPDDTMAFTPVSFDDYFRQQGINVEQELTGHPAEEAVAMDSTVDKSLMVMMSFTEWLMHFRNKSRKNKEDEEGQKAVKSMWQKEKLAAAMEEEDDEIPENVFEMAVNSIAKEEGLASESLADIYVKQKKYDQAIEMYKKLSLRNPQKSAYFAHKIDIIIKQRES
jgi:tetratricopeptide (TPR) repeat protein